jgi:hypothetical protein
MIDIDAELLDLDAGWREVLEAYRLVDETQPVASQGLPSRDPAGETDGEGVVLGLAELPAEDERDDWLPRIESLEGFDPERLSELHGRLIALGWLGFEVSDRTTGMRYKISRDGQRVLDGLVPIPTLRVVGNATVAVRGADGV